MKVSASAIPATASFHTVIYDYNYKLFIAAGAYGTVATSSDGKKWNGYNIPEMNRVIAIESSTSEDSGVLLMTGRTFYQFDPKHGAFTLLNRLPESASLAVTSAKLGVIFRSIPLTDKITNIQVCYPEGGKMRCRIYGVINSKVIRMTMTGNDENILMITTENADNLDQPTSNWVSQYNNYGYNFVPFNIPMVDKGDELSASGEYIFDWRRVKNPVLTGEANIIAGIFIPLNQLAPTQWTPLGAYHQPERMDRDTYAAVYFGRRNDSGLSDDEDSDIVIAGTNQQEGVQLFVAEISVNHNVFRPFLNQQFNMVRERHCGASARINGSVITILLGYGNQVLWSNDKTRHLWTVLRM